MRLPYKKAETASTIYRLGISYHGFGILQQGKVQLFDYFKCDKVTQEQIESLRSFCPDLQVKSSSPSYAPEIRNVLLCFPKSAWYRSQRNA